MRWALVSVFLLTGCFGPEVGQVVCGPDGLCPRGTTCDFEAMICRGRGDLLPDAGADTDAPKSDVDSDEDGINDSDDNCPTVANNDQADEDGDERGNVCDNCPGVENTDQADDLEVAAGGVADGVGDACDPRPASDGDSIFLFEPFDTLDAWTVAFGADTWTATGGQAIQDDNAPTNHQLMLAGEMLERTAITTKFTPLELPPAGGGSPIRSVGSLAHMDGGGRAYACTIFYDAADATPDPTLILFRIGIGGVRTPINSTAGPMLALGESYRTTIIVDGTANTHACRAATTNFDESTTGSDANFNTGGVGLRTSGSRAAFDYVTVFALGQ